MAITQGRLPFVFGSDIEARAGGGCTRGPGRAMPMPMPVSVTASSIQSRPLATPCQQAKLFDGFCGD
jgi:hypothetical protein